MRTKRRVLLRAIAIALTSVGMTIGPAMAEETDTDAAVSAELEGLREISPEATKVLPVQPEDRGHVMPLHAASVLSWLCADPSTQAQVGGSKADCYREIYPVVELCTAQLQEKAPAAQNMPVAGRMDVVSFRATFRECLKEQYAAAQAARGLQPPQFSEGAPDPLAARMSGQR